MKIEKLILSAAIVMTGSSGFVAEAASFADYVPLSLGSYWTYENAANSADTYTESVFESFVFNGHPAVKYGDVNGSYTIGFNNGYTVNLYGEVDSGGTLNDYPDVSISTITDGMVYQTGLEKFNLIRIWDNLDATQKSIYNIDPGLNNLILMANYDGDDGCCSSNYQNAIVESNLGFSLPDYAVSGLTWWQSGVGQIINLDIQAYNGAIGDRYNLVNYYIAPVPIPSALFLFGSALLGIMGISGKSGKVLAPKRDI